MPVYRHNGHPIPFAYKATAGELIRRMKDRDIIPNNDKPVVLLTPPEAPGQDWVPHAWNDLIQPGDIWTEESWLRVKV